MPPVSGGMLVCVGRVFSQLGLPSAGLSVAGLLLMILDFILTGFKIGITHDMCLRSADKMGMVNRDILEKPLR